MTQMKRKDLKLGDCFRYNDIRIAGTRPMVVAINRVGLPDEWGWSTPESPHEHDNQDVTLLESYVTHRIPTLRTEQLIRTSGTCRRDEVRQDECFVYASGTYAGRKIIASLNGTCPSTYLKSDHTLMWSNDKPHYALFDLDHRGSEIVTLVPISPPVAFVSQTEVTTIDGLPVLEIKSRFTLFQRADGGRGFPPLTPTQKAYASAWWSENLRLKAAASEASSMEKARMQVVCERDEDGE